MRPNMKQRIWLKGCQDCLDIVVKASDWLQAHPDHKLDIFDVLARIITDIQVLESTRL